MYYDFIFELNMKKEESEFLFKMKKDIWIIIKLELLKKVKFFIFLFFNLVKICNIIIDVILLIFRKLLVSCFNLNLIFNEYMIYFIY